jgi:hypothetical protein
MSEWIAVGNRLPDEHQDVLVYYRQPSAAFEGLHYITQSSYYNERFETDLVTHWMPIIAPPTE